MHLMEAIMDLKTGNAKGAMMELKSMMAHMKGNTTSSSMVPKNATS
jgi:hypothetical protein